MKTKIKRLLYEYTKNSRITTKELGKRIGTSQQSASYILKTMKKKKLIESNTAIIDAVKLGFINILVGFNFINPDPQIKKDILDELKKIDDITYIEEGKEGIDLLIEYMNPNLSAFNKVQTEVIKRFHDKIKTDFVFPVIVVHEYTRNYLVRKIDFTDKVIFGDRTLRDLSKKEFKVLMELARNPEKNIVELSTSSKINIKTFMNLKKVLEKKNIIKGYSCILDFLKLGINRQIIFLRMTGGAIKDIDNLSLFSRNNKNIVRLMKTIGEFNIVVFVENLTEADILNQLRSNYSIEKYRIIKPKKIHKRTYIPLNIN